MPAWLAQLLGRAVPAALVEVMLSDLPHLPRPPRPAGSAFAWCASKMSGGRRFRQDGDLRGMAPRPVRAGEPRRYKVLRRVGSCEGWSEARVEGSHMRSGATGFPGRSSYVPVRVEAGRPPPMVLCPLLGLPAGPELARPVWLRSVVTVSS